MGQNFSKLEYGVRRELTYAKVPMQFSISIDFREKNLVCHIAKKAVSCTSQESDNFTTPYYPFFAPLSVKWLLTRG